MTFAAGSEHGLRYIAETTFGTDPVSYATVRKLRNTSCSLEVAKDTFASNELRDDRQVSCLRHGAIRVQGDIGFELSYGEYDALIAAALCSDWSAGTLKAGKTHKSFQFERAFTDITAYGKFTGCMVNTMTLNIPANGIVTGTFGIVGKNGSYSGTPLTASPLAATTHCAYDTFTGTLEEGGSEIAIVTSLDLSITNERTPALVIGSQTTPEIGAGKFVLTGTLSAYVTNYTLMNKFINETPSSLNLTLGGSLNYYTISLPNIKYTGASNPASGPGYIMMSLPFQALYNAGDLSNIVWTRSPISGTTSTTTTTSTSSTSSTSSSSSMSTTSTAP